MKISARTCSTPEKPSEPDLEFYLEETSHYVVLAVRDKNSGLVTSNFILSIRKTDGKLQRYGSINAKFGLPLDSSGRLKLITEA
jgi:hypothetical protein